MIDIHTIGAGGGSIARVDRGGAFRVGPESAGAVPGPAAYGRGGSEPTVTDANVVLGRLDRDYFLGGAMALDETAASAAIGRLLRCTRARRARNGGRRARHRQREHGERHQLAYGAEGIDPREFSLVAFGGAGPLHAVEVASRLGIPEVIVPPFPGITSAVGLLTTDLRYDAVKTEFQVSDALDLGRLNEDLVTVEAGIGDQFRSDGVDLDEVRFERSGDLRYAGQGYELRIPLPPEELGSAEADDLFRRFHEQHRAEYGHVFEESLIEIVNIPGGRDRPDPHDRRSARGRRRIARYGPDQDGTRDVPSRWCARRAGDRLLFARAAFLSASRSRVPPSSLQRDSTTVVPPGSTAVADEAGNLIITIEGSP